MKKRSGNISEMKNKRIFSKEIQIFR